jgi:hypothetical protein
VYKNEAGLSEIAPRGPQQRQPEGVGHENVRGGQNLRCAAGINEVAPLEQPRRGGLVKTGHAHVAHAIEFFALGQAVAPPRDVRHRVAAPREFAPEREPDFLHRAAAQRRHREKRALDDGDAHENQSAPPSTSICRWAAASI